MPQLQELLKTPATNEDPSQQLSRVLAMLRAAWTFKYGQAVICVPPALHDAYEASLASRPAFRTFARGRVLTFAETPLVPLVPQTDDNYITVVSQEANTRHWTYPDDPMHGSD